MTRSANLCGRYRSTDKPLLRRDLSEPKSWRNQSAASGSYQVLKHEFISLDLPGLSFLVRLKESRDCFDVLWFTALIDLFAPRLVTER